MATVNYIIRGKATISTIYVRVRDGRQTDLTASTDILINPIYWSTKKGDVKQTAEFKEKLIFVNKLKGLQSLLIDCIQIEKMNGRLLTQDWLKHSIDIFHNRVKDQSNEFIFLFEQKKLSLSDRINKVSIHTIKCYSTTIQRLKKFEGYKNKTLHIQDIDLTFHSEYVDYCKKVLGLSVNSISKDIKQIKTVCFDAKDRGLNVNEQALSKRFNAPTEKTEFVTLTEKEINLIKGFTGPDYLENARDWLIIGCWTGCRIKDLIQLNNTKVLTSKEGKEYIRYTQNKTDRTVDIPLHPQVIEILGRLKGFPREISDVKFNVYIKEVCKRVGITNEVQGSKANEETRLKETGIFPKYQLIRSHTCRRSFATNHYNKLPNKVIMAVTGHTTERQFLEYIGEQENSHMNEFIDVWDSIQIEQ